jgi:hypothetical protein
MLTNNVAPNVIAAAQAELASWTTLIRGQNDANISLIVQKTESIFISWSSGLLEYELDESAINQYNPTVNIINTILDPYTDGPSLKMGHPLSIVQTPALQGRYIPGFLLTPEIPALLTLAVLNDLLEGSIGAGTSIFMRQIAGGAHLPANLSGFNIGAPSEWEDLGRVINNLMYSLGQGKIAFLNVGLVGGSRYKKTRKQARGTRRARKTISRKRRN